MNKNSIYAETQDKKDYKADKKITSKQWKIYYYMLGQSKYDSINKEDHRYLYKRDFNVTKSCKLLGIKSVQTFYNAIERLSQRGLIYDYDNYYLLYSHNWIEVEKETLNNLVKYAYTKEQDIDLLRTYLILKKMDKIAENSDDRAFTLKTICILLGRGNTHSIYYANVRLYLALLSFWGLIELKQHLCYNAKLNAHYTVFHLQKVSEQSPNPDFESDIEAEMLAPDPSPELINKLKFVYPDLLKEK